MFRAVGGHGVLFLHSQGSGTGFQFRKMALVAKRSPDEQQAVGPRAGLCLPLVFLPQLFPFQLTLAPRFLPNTLISVDFAANYLTKIYGLTFGQKPNLRSEVRGQTGALGSGWGRGRS